MLHLRLTKDRVQPAAYQNKSDSLSQIAIPAIAGPRKYSLLVFAFGYLDFHVCRLGEAQSSEKLVDRAVRSWKWYDM